MMFKRIAVFITIFIAAPIAATAVTSRAGVRNSTTRESANPTSAYNYNYMYPYLNNQMRTDLNPGGVTPSQGSNPIDVITRTESLSGQRRVVARKGSVASARAGTMTTGTTAASQSTVRSAAAPAGTQSAMRAATPQGSTARRVVARAGSATSARAGRADSSATNRIAADSATNNTTVTVSSSRCLADYRECMNGYCQRENTKYNRCYCSSRLSQIDAEYQPAIDKLIKQILALQYTNNWSAAEMDEYWMSTIGKYTGDNSWNNIDSALNIDWANLESRVRGQQAFTTGHDYCVQHLRGCYYMASNLRDAYRSEIARDCSTYEQSLQKLKNAAESIVESYK